MNEPRPLPIGREEFEQWSDRIISGALVSADADSQKYALANLIIHLGPTESHKPDAHFIHSLRKVAANQVADALRKEYYAKAKAKEAPQPGDPKTHAAAHDNNLLSAVPDAATPADPTKLQ